MQTEVADARVRRRIPIALKLAASVSLLMLGCVCVLAVFLLNHQSRLIGAHADDFSTLITEQLASTAVEPLFTDERYELEALVRHIAANDRILGAAIFNRDGEQLALAGSVPSFALLDRSRPYQKLAPSKQPLVAGKDFVRAAPVSVHLEPIKFKGVLAGYAVASYSQDAIVRGYNHSLKLLGFITTLLMIAMCLVVFSLGKRVTRPLTALVAATEAIDRGDFTQIEERRNDEIGQLINAVNHMGQGSLNRTQVENVMGQLLAKDVAAKVLNKLDTIQVGGEQVHATVLFADIVGFTEISENLTPREVSELLNEYFTYLDACARFYFGTIDKYIGDCVMVVFGSPKPDPDHQYHAVSCAVLMQKLIQRVNEQRVQQGKYTVNLRIGINSGTMLAGLLGSNDRLEYTVVGDSVNIASRLCNEAASGQIIIQESLYEEIRQLHNLCVEQHKKIKLRGKSVPVSVYNVYAVEQAHPMAMENLIDDVISHRRAA